MLGKNSQATLAECYGGDGPYFNNAVTEIALGEHAILELPEISEGKLLICRIGKSPLPHDDRPCAFAQQVSEPHD